MKTIEKFLKSEYKNSIAHRVYAIDSEYLYVKAVSKLDGDLVELIVPLSKINEKMKLGR